ncbi:MAG: hypothetical protein WC614_13090 [bacterium]
MFRRKRHINAKNNEWYVIHRNGSQDNNLGIARIIGMGAGVLILALLAWKLIQWVFSLFVAALPFLILAGAAIIAFVVVRKQT